MSGWRLWFAGVVWFVGKMNVACLYINVVPCSSSCTISAISFDTRLRVRMSPFIVWSIWLLFCSEHFDACVLHDH